MFPEHQLAGTSEAYAATVWEHVGALRCADDTLVQDDALLLIDAQDAVDERIEPATVGLSAHQEVRDRIGRRGDGLRRRTWPVV